MESVLDLQGFSSWVTQAPKEFFGGFLRHLRDHFIPHPRNNYHPHIFSQRLTSLFAVLLVAVKVFALAYLSLGPVLPAYSSAITAENIIALTNESRANYQLKVLTENSVLDRAAQAKADNMAQKGYFAHQSPDGRLPWNFIQSAGYNYLMAGENLAVNFVEAESVSEAWMNSPTHKANILNKNFEEIGIGIAEGNFSGRTSIFVVQMFGAPAEQKIALKNQPTKIEQREAALPALAQSSSEAGESQAGRLVIEDVAFGSAESQLTLTVKTSPTVTKVLAIYGSKAVRLLSQPDGTWQSSLSLSDLSQARANLLVKVFDINGQQAQVPAGVFANSAIANYNFQVSGQVAGKQVLVWGKALNLENFQHNFYLLFVAAVLTCLVLAIAIRRHVQHMAVVANGSFVAILAILLWLGG